MNESNRRRFLRVAGFGTAATLSALPQLEAAEPTDAEKANIKVVNDFCAAWAGGPKLETMMAFFADNCAYRVTEDRDLIKGREAVTTAVTGLLARVVRFDVLDTYAKGPMVFNERIDYFLPNAPLRSWHGVGVFFLKDRKIVEWQDYTISRERS